MASATLNALPGSKACPEEILPFVNGALKDLLAQIEQATAPSSADFPIAPIAFCLRPGLSSRGSSPTPPADIVALESPRRPDDPRWQPVTDCWTAATGSK